MHRPLAFVAALLTAAAHAQETAPSSSPNQPSAPAASGSVPQQSEPARAQDTEREEPELSLIVPGERSVLMQPQSIGVLDRSDVRRNEGLFLDDAMNLLPGVRVESRTVSGGQRITIRGYGNQTNFNGVGYKAYLNGIPITDAEGTTILDDLDVSLLGRIEVVKGPASSLYGTGIGGVVRFSTILPERDVTRLVQELEGGTGALFRSNTRLESGTDNSSFLLNYGHQHDDGPRIHSLSNKDSILLAGDWRPSSRQALSYVATFTHSFDQLAGQLTEDQYLARQNVAEAPYLANNGHVAIDSVRLGISHRYDIFSALSNTTSAFATGYQLDQPFAVGLSDTLALNVGGRTEFDFRVGGPSLRLDVIAGSEVERSISFRKSYGLVNSVVGGIRGDLQVISTQSNTFAQANLGLPLEITATAGASLNIVRYAITDRLANSANPTHLNQSGTLTFDPVVTPRFALQKAFGPDVSVYAQVSQGYSAPGSGSVVIPQIGQVNRDLRPERGTLYEIGSKASLFGGRLGYEVALFDLHVSDKLTSQAVTASNGSVLYTITTNAGNQKDRGVELALRYAFVRDEGAPLSLLQAFVSYTYSHFRYDGFKSDANNNAATIDYTGRKVVGVPDHVVAAGIDVGSGVGLYGNATLQYNGREPLTYDNAHFAPDYTLVSAKAGYRRDLPAGFRLDAFAGVRNIFDATWYSMVFLNSSYAGPPPNVYLPGFGTTFYGGFSVSKAL